MGRSRRELGERVRKKKKQKAWSRRGMEKMEDIAKKQSQCHKDREVAPVRSAMQVQVSEVSKLMIV